MKRIPLFLLILISITVFSMKVDNDYQVGLSPTKIIQISNSTGKYFVVLSKGDSTLIVLDQNFKPIRIVDDMNRDGIVDIVYNGNYVYCPGFYSGRLCILDVSGSPSKWAVKDKISMSSKIMTGVFSGKIFGLLSYNKEFILYDSKRNTITKRIELPVEALSVVSDGSYFYVSLFYNYSLLRKAFDVEFGVLVFDMNGNEIKRLEAGKRPSYMVIDRGVLAVVSYWSEELIFFSTTNFRELARVPVGKYPNFPVIIDNSLWIASTGVQKVYSVNLSDYTVREHDTYGSGPLRILKFDDEIYVFSAISGTIEKLDGNESDFLDLDGYPIDVISSNNRIAVVLQEDWSSINQNGKLLILE